MHALIVEDSQTMQQVLSATLTSLGFTTSTAADAWAAVLRLDHGPPPDLIVVDHNLPGPSGMDFIATVRASGLTREPKVLMVSAESDRAFVERALTVGVDEYLFKPFTPDALSSKLTLLGLRKSRTGAPGR